MKSRTEPYDAEADGQMFNVAAKHISFGIARIKVTAIDHEGMPGVLVQQIPHGVDPEEAADHGLSTNPFPNVIVVSEATDLVMTFEQRDSARALVNAILSVVGFDEIYPEAEPDMQGPITVNPRAQRVIKAIEAATLAARVAGSTSSATEHWKADQASARDAENAAVRVVLQEFKHLPA